MGTKDDIDISGDGNQDIASRKTYHRPIVNQMTGGTNTIYTGGNDDAAREDLVGKFLAYISGQDDTIKEQSKEIKRLGEYLSNIISKSYMRNKENMDRIDKDRDRFDRLIDIIEHQDKKIQDRADRVLAILEKKIGI
jgi:hypothetical protein